MITGVSANNAAPTVKANPAFFAECATFQDKGIVYALVSAHAYHGPDGNTIAWFNGRFENCAEPRTFRPLVVRNGKAAIKSGTTPMPEYLPFRHHDIEQAGPGCRVLITEGESDANAAASLGFIATNGKKLTPAHDRFLAGRQLVICADHDSAGEVQAAALVERLKSVGDVVPFWPTTLKGKGDFCDLVASLREDGLDDEDVRCAINEMIAEAKLDWSEAPRLPGNGTAAKSPATSTASDARSSEALSANPIPTVLPQVASFADLVPEPREWLLPPYLPSFGLMVLGGRGSHGKTTTNIALGAWCSVGKIMEHRFEPRRCLVFERQDSDAHEIKPKLIANGYDSRMVIRLVNKKAPTIEELEGLIIEHALGYVSLSPGRSFTSQYCGDNEDSELEPILDMLGSIAEKHRCLISLTKHLNKKPDLDISERIGGAGCWVNSPRAVVMMAYDRENDIRKAELFKVNGGIPHTWRLDFTDTGQDASPTNKTAYVRVDMYDDDGAGDSVEQLLAPKKPAKTAGGWLMQYLKDNGGMAEARVIFDAGGKDGHSQSALEGAQQRNPKILSFKPEFRSGWWWKLSQLDDTAKVDGL